MTFKDLLVQIDLSPRNDARLDLAIDLARRHGAHLIGLCALAETHIPEVIRSQIPEDILARQRQTLEDATARVRDDFQARTRAAGIDAEWRLADGDVHELYRLHARHADLAIVGQPGPADDAPGGLDSLPGQLALEIGRPLLVVPFAGRRFTPLGERVLVAWDNSREAVRAVNDALPLLRRAGRVILFAVNPRDRDHGDIPGADIALHLARHGVKAEAAHTVADDIAVGDVILDRLADEAVDLLVMGAYGRSRLREMILGGVTRHLMRHMTVPVLLSH